MDSFIDQAVDWLHPYVGKEIDIIKEEDGDQDRIRLHLERVSFGENQFEDIDGYVAKQAILLHGEGAIVQANSDATLPQRVYEIPITEEMRITLGINAITFHSDRALYHISSNQKSVD